MRKLLIIDDDPGIVTLIKSLLAEKIACDGSKIDVCHTIEEVKSYFEAGAKVDVIFLDLVIPPNDIKDTLALIPWLNQHCTTLAIISGHDSARDQCLKLGAHGFISKLEDMRSSKTFLEKLAGFCREWGGPTETDKAIERLHGAVTPALSNGQ